jgi:hypothetical protein
MDLRQLLFTKKHQHSPEVQTLAAAFSKARRTEVAKAMEKGSE